MEKYGYNIVEYVEEEPGAHLPPGVAEAFRVVQNYLNSTKPAGKMATGNGIPDYLGELSKLTHELYQPGRKQMPIELQQTMARIILFTWMYAGACGMDARKGMVMILDNMR